MSESERMSVTFVMNYWKGGGPRNVYTLSNLLSAKGIDSEVFAFFDSRYIPISVRNKYDFGTKTFDAKISYPEKYLSLLNTLFLPFYSPTLLTSIPFFIMQEFLEPKSLKSQEGDFFIATNWQTLIPIYKGKGYCSSKILYFVQAHEVDFSTDSFYRAMAKKTYILPILIFTQSKWLASYLDDIYGGKTEYVGLGIDHKVFRPIKVQRENTISTIVRKDKNKGFSIFVDALNKLWKIRKDFSVILIGEDPKFIKKIIHFPFTYIGWVKDDKELAYIYSKSIFVSTGNNEALPMPPLEAMACGSSVVLTDIPGSKEYAIDHKNCIKCKAWDSMSIVEAISELLDSDNLRSYLSKNAVLTAERYNWDDTLERFLKVLEKLRRS